MKLDRVRRGECYAEQPGGRYWKEGAKAFGTATDSPIPESVAERF